MLFLYEKLYSLINKFVIDLTYVCFCSDLTILDLAIPDAFCSPVPEYGYQCPEGMKCMALELPKSKRGFDGFDEFCMHYFI